MTVHLNNATVNQLVDEYFTLKGEIQAKQQRSKAIIERLARFTDGRDAVIGPYKLTRVERKGSIQYAEAVKQLLPEADLEQFRGAPSEFWRLS